MGHRVHVLEYSCVQRDKMPTRAAGTVLLLVRHGDRYDYGTGAKAWKEIWGSGQGIGAVKEIQPVADLVDRFEREYNAARERLSL